MKLPCFNWKGTFRAVRGQGWRQRGKPQEWVRSGRETVVGEARAEHRSMGPFLYPGEEVDLVKEV